MMRVEYDRNMLRRVEKKLGRMKREAPKVLKTALNDTAKVGRKDLADKAQKTYAVKKSGFNKSMKINKARVNNLEAEIVSEGRPLGLKDFKVTPASYKPGSGQPPEIIKAKVVKSSSYKPLEKGGIKAFVTRFSSGHVAVAQRRGDARLPIKTLSSNSIPKMIGNEERVYRFVKPKIQENLKKNVNKQIEKVLSKR